MEPDGASPAAARFRRRFEREPGWLAHAPGRINLLGAHVDYHEGLVLPAAIDRGLDFAAATRPDRRLRLLALDYGDEVAEFELDALPPPPVADGRPSHWSDLPAGVAAACLDRGLELPGLDVAFGGDLPRGAGVSSSAAVEVGLLRIWAAVAGWSLADTELAALGRHAENHYLGVGSGIMDQLACLVGRESQLLALDCRDLDYRHLPIAPDRSFLVVDSGVRRRLGASGFNDRRSEAESALDSLRRLGLPLATLRDLTMPDLERHAELLSPVEYRRARHVVEECERVRRAWELLEEGRTPEIGPLLAASHASSRDLYEVSIAELDLLAASLNGAQGCDGARLSGGGFGGCVCALVQTGRADAVALATCDAFEERFGRRPHWFTCRAADGAVAVAAPF